MKKTVIISILAMAVCLACIVGFNQNAEAAGGTAISSGGTLVISVNPKIAVKYNADGYVIEVKALNTDAGAIVKSCKDLKGLKARSAAVELVNAIGKSGYFTDKTGSSPRQITIEIEKGSKLPYRGFMDDIVSDVRKCLSSNKWTANIDVQNKNAQGRTDYDVTDYGRTDYNDTDYGSGSDGVTDYGRTDYNDTDYGKTDYNDIDYGKTDYNETDYGQTDYNETDYGKTDYNDTDYGKTDYND